MPNELGKSQCPHAHETFHGRPRSADSVQSFSLNLDDRHFERADHFNIHRAYNPHLSFGRGRHICLGTKLAKSEIEAALRALLKHVSPEHYQFENLGWSLSVGHR